MSQAQQFGDMLHETLVEIGTRAIRLYYAKMMRRHRRRQAKKNKHRQWLRARQ